MKNVIIWDLDGTLSDGTHRIHLLPTKDYGNTKSWEAFNLASGDDTPFQDNIDLMNSLRYCGFDIVILTGRSDIAREITEKWLDDHGCHYDALIMRPFDDHRRDIDFKREELEAIGIDNILCAFDDAEHVVKFMRSLGITCHQVTHYEIKHAHVKSHEENEGKV